MAFDLRNPEALSSLGQTIRKRREALGWTQEKLADRAGYSDKIIRNVEHGIKTKIQTIKDVCNAVELSDDTLVGHDRIVSDSRYGSYNLDHYVCYAGIYLGFRRIRSVDVDFLRTAFEILWLKEKRCLGFVEDYKYTYNNGRMVDFSSSGEIYINNNMHLLNLLTNDAGAIGLIMLSMLSSDINTLEGVALTYFRNSHYYSPAVCPIYLKRAEEVTSRRLISQLVGPIAPADEIYQSVAAVMGRVEQEAGFFPSAFSLDSDVARISRPASKPPN